MNAANLNLVAFSRLHQPELMTGQVFAIFGIGIAACEAAVGLALILTIYRRFGSTDVDSVDLPQGVMSVAGFLMADPPGRRSSCVLLLVAGGVCVNRGRTVLPLAQGGRGPGLGRRSCCAAPGPGRAVAAFSPSGAGPVTELDATWFSVGSLEVPFSLRVDGLQGIMAVVVAGVSLLVQLFSVGYMHGRPGRGALLRRALPVQRRHAAAGAGRRLLRALRGLGAGGSHLVPADLLLLRTPGGGRRRARRPSSPPGWATWGCCSASSPSGRSPGSPATSTRCSPGRPRSGSWGLDGCRCRC